MSANQLFLAILVALLIGKLALSAACVKLGLKWAGIANVSMIKALGLYFFVTIICLLFAGVTVFVIRLALRIDEPSQLIGFLLCTALILVFASATVAWMYRVRIVLAAKAMIPYTLADVALFVLSIAISSYAYEGFSVPENAMAPTLLGTHWITSCPRCGHPAYGPPPGPRAPVAPEGVLMICSNELQSVLVSDTPKAIEDGDRIMTCKFIAPRRWDMVVFRTPEDPTVKYVKRLVGLPNEKLEIRDGAVWINGEKLEPPETLKGIKYSPTIEWAGQVHSGPGSWPVRLGPDEYFVLGDFVQLSSDSRMWRGGAPGHPPYAVPESYIIGVVINIYWPINRWQAFR
jgi:signal peptidase I